MLLVTHCNAFVIWACVVAATMAFDFHSGGLLPCLMPVSLYIFDRWYPDMIWHVCCGMFWHVSVCQVVYWHVLANGFVLFTWTLLTGAILSSRQDTTRACKNREKKHAGLAGFSDNPYLTTPTQHVMVGITRSKVIFSPEDLSRSPMRDQDRSRLFCFAGKQTSKQQKNRKCSGAGLDISTWLACFLQSKDDEMCMCGCGF